MEASPRNSVNHIHSMFYECEICTEIFSQSYNLRQHISKNHTNKRTHGYKHLLNGQDDLIINVKPHNNDKLYQCKHCGKKFKHPVSSVEHARKCKFKQNTSLSDLSVKEEHDFTSDQNDMDTDAGSQTTKSYLGSNVDNDNDFSPNHNESDTLTGSQTLKTLNVYLDKSIDNKLKEESCVTETDTVSQTSKDHEEAGISDTSIGKEDIENDCMEVQKENDTKEIFYCCNKCGQNYTDKTQFDSHLNTHTENSKPPDCISRDDSTDTKHILDYEQSDQSFTEKSQFDTYLTAHSENNKSLKNCEKTFIGSRTRNLKKHVVAMSHQSEKTFPVKIALREHSELYPIEKTNQCNLCKESFMCKKSLTQHLKKHTTEKNHKCNECDKAFTCKNYLKNHMDNHKEQKPYECETCGEGCDFALNLDYHRYKHSQEQNMQKGYENKKTDKKSNHKCEICYKEYKDIYLLRRHMRKHAEQQRYECKECHKAYSELYQLENHIRTHTGEKPFKCEYCQKVFSTKRLLKLHLITHKSDKCSLIVCDVCGKTFSHYLHFKAHKKRHVKDKRYKCDQCGKDFPFHTELKRHMISHSGVKPYMCKQCGTGFLNISALNLHTKDFHGDKPYNCEICEKAFRQKSQLDVHMRSHTGENPFMCVECGKGFRFKNSLTKHQQNIHYGVKPFKCNDCKECFAKLSDLRKHVNIHPIMYTCKQCGEKFISKYFLKLHMKCHSDNTCNKETL